MHLLGIWLTNCYFPHSRPVTCSLATDESYHHTNPLLPGICILHSCPLHLHKKQLKFSGKCLRIKSMYNYYCHWGNFSRHKILADIDDYTLWFIKKRGNTFVIVALEIFMGFNNFCISGNGNECPLHVSYLLIYFTWDVNMLSLSRSWHWWAATSSAACVARVGAVADWWRSWPMVNMLACLSSCQWWTF